MRSTCSCDHVRRPIPLIVTLTVPACRLQQRQSAALTCREAFRGQLKKQQFGCKAVGAQTAAESVPQQVQALVQAAKRRTTFYPASEGELDRYRHDARQILAREPVLAGLSDAELKARTAAFKQSLSAAQAGLEGADRDRAEAQCLDALLPEAFAVVREAARRVLGMQHFEVQLMGGLALHEGRIAEMQTGEGKTLVATLPVYLHALLGQGVHLVTVNAYLAARDADWVGGVLQFLGLTVGLAEEHAEPDQQQAAFRADVTYTTPATLAFAYLRDNNSIIEPDKLVLERPLHFALVDEADYLLIDQATNPYLLSGNAAAMADRKAAVACKMVNQLMSMPDGSQQHALQPGRDFEVDSVRRTTALTEAGMTRILAMLEAMPGESLSSATAQQRPAHILDLWETAPGPDGKVSAPWGSFLHTALRARWCFQEGVDYLIINKSVKIIDQASGRLMEKTRWTDMLHQAVEYQHGLDVELDRPTQCSVTVQNLFRRYRHLCGMTGTAMTEQEELSEVYGLQCIAIPTAKPRIRVDAPPAMYWTRFDADEVISQEVQNALTVQQPVLIGTSSVEESDALLRALKLRDWRLEVSMLNAQPHVVKQEAQIIAQAGLPGSVTIATNMAGRGTDIILGGNPHGLVQIVLANFWFPLLMSGEAHQADLASIPAVPQLLHEFGHGEQLLQGGTGSFHLMQQSAALCTTLQQTGEQLAAVYSKGLSLASCTSLLQSMSKRVEALSLLFQRTASGIGPEQSLADYKRLSRQLSGFCDRELGPEISLPVPDGNIATRQAMRAALLLWVWLHLRCQSFAATVRAVGGLLVISAVAQPNRRSVLQLRGRAGRRGDPGRSLALCSWQDFNAERFLPRLTGMLAQRLEAAKHQAFGEPLPQFSVSMLQHIMTQHLEDPKTDARRRVNEMDAAIDPLRLAGYRLRRSILCMSAAQHATLLHSLFYAFAEELVQKFVDPGQSPKHWDNLENLILYVRLLVNPHMADSSGRMRIRASEPFNIPEHLSPQTVVDLRQNLHKAQMTGTAMPIQHNAPFADVLGDASAADAAQAIRVGLSLGPSAMLPANHRKQDLPEALQTELAERRASHAAAGSGAALHGRHAGAARRLAVHLAEDLVVAWSCLRLPALQRVARPLQPHFHLCHSGDSNTVEAWQRGMLLHSLDSLWAGFMEDCQRLHQGASLRGLAHHDPRLEFRVESGNAFVRLLERFRRTAVTNVFEGPSLDGCMHGKKLQESLPDSHANRAGNGSNDSIDGLEPADLASAVQEPREH